MKCPNCGAQLNEGVSFCTYCGTQITGVQNNVNQNNMPNQGPNNMQNLNNPNNKKTPWGLIIGAIVLAVIIIAIFVGISMSKEENDTPNKSNDKNINETNETKEEETKTVTYDDFTFDVPSGFNATPSSSQLLITNDNNTVASAIIYQSGTGYDTLSSMKDQIITLLKAQEASQSQNYDFTNATTEEKTYNGTRFLITKGITQGSIELDITYAEAPDGVFVVSIAKNSGIITNSDRDTLYSIVATANNSNF